LRRFLAFAAFMIAVATSFGFATQSPAQDSVEDQVNAYHRKNEAEIDLYLAKHPVRSSPLFEAAARLIAVVGRFDAMIIDACEYDPAFPDWRDAARGLRENTVVALGKSYVDEMRKEIDETPASHTFRDRSLCADEKRHRESLFRQLKSTLTALRREGY
jgi:hypothetical protein